MGVKGGAGMRITLCSSNCKLFFKSKQNWSFFLRYFLGDG